MFIHPIHWNLCYQSIIWKYDNCFIEIGFNFSFNFSSSSLTGGIYVGTMKYDCISMHIYVYIYYTLCNVMCCNEVVSVREGEPLEDGIVEGEPSTEERN